LTAIPVQTATVSTAAQYAFPISQGAVSYGKDHHDYPATDIFCDEGSTFVAVTDGVIDSIVGVDRWDPTTDVPADRSGRAVALIGDDGVRYYGSHLSTIAPGLTVGQRVRVGTLLGYTGKSGNARFTPPHLHFGISQPTTPDDWQVRRGQISPYPYLTAWAQGESLTPLLDQ
jgi:murein DD-endopeptidase MepM/ murein hydrolase activator NlpD